MARHGLIPRGGGCSQRLPRGVGEQRAKALLLLAPWLSGEEAVAYGLALRSVDSAQAVEFEIRTFVDYMGRLPHGREGYRLDGRQTARLVLTHQPWAGPRASAAVMLLRARKPFILCATLTAAAAP